MSGLAVGVFGVPGVGKSTLLAAHVAQCAKDRHIEGSSVIKAVIAPASVRDLDGWSADRQDAARAEAIRRLEIERARCPGVLLVDGHFSLRNRATGQLGAVVTAEDKAFYDALVLVDATEHAVMEQARIDIRSRHGQEPGAVAEHLALERALAGPTASEMRVELLVITEASLEARLVALAGFLASLTCRA